MTAILNNNEVFLHVPKTGGSFIKRTLQEMHLVKNIINDTTSHMPIASLRQKFGWHDDKMPFFIAFVRYPVTWYESYFRFMSIKRLSPQHKDRYMEKNYPLLYPEKIMCDLYTEGNLTFDTFIRAVLKQRPGFVTELYSFYTTLECSFIGKQENLNQDLIHLLKLRGYKFDPFKINNSSTFNVAPGPPVKWDEGLKREILKTEAICLWRYNYEDS